ncbi:hypothetical protein DPMN_001526 [Dreissena polymorpha]|uniref:Uncharacterized protein n=1 Tax=Dreissena polymorpha TaxID=45954 RepID=A0A9D4RSZ7_DREPO|nr:hypothetical protein DPMN_001526 [Dreissena polymorpha]
MTSPTVAHTYGGTVVMYVTMSRSTGVAVNLAVMRKCGTKTVRSVTGPHTCVQK